MKTKTFSSFILSIYCIIIVFAQEISADYKFSITYFPLENQLKVSAIFVNPGYLKVVNIAANAFQEDIFESFTGLVINTN